MKKTPIETHHIAAIVLLIFCTSTICAPIDEVTSWDENGAEELQPVEMNDKTQAHEQQDVFKMASLLSEEEQQVLNELKSIIKHDRKVSKNPDGFTINLDQKSRVITPYFLKNTIPTTPKRVVTAPYFMKKGVSSPYFMKKAAFATPYFLKRGVSSPYFMKKGVSTPYFLKRDGEGSIVAPYFMRRSVNTPYFLKREGIDLPEEVSMAGPPAHMTSHDDVDVDDVVDGKRIFGRMNSLDLENFLALQGADDKYSRQLSSNEQRMRIAGK